MRATRRCIAMSRLKVLPDLVSGDPDRLARFEREAQLACRRSIIPTSAAFMASRKLAACAALFSNWWTDRPSPTLIAGGALPLDAGAGDRPADRGGARSRA